MVGPGGGWIGPFCGNMGMASESEIAKVAWSFENRSADRW